MFRELFNRLFKKQNAEQPTIVVSEPPIATSTIVSAPVIEAQPNAVKKPRRPAKPSAAKSSVKNEAAWPFDEPISATATASRKKSSKTAKPDQTKTVPAAITSNKRSTTATAKSKAKKPPSAPAPVVVETAQPAAKKSRKYKKNV